MRLRCRNDWGQSFYNLQSGRTNMRHLATATTAFFSGILFLGSGLMNSSTQEPEPLVGTVHQMAELKEQLAETKKPWLQFLDVPSMYCGVYHLKAGSQDGQAPHGDDEVYYVESGKAKFVAGDKESDVVPGTILFVPAKMEHRFHSIEEDITLLVFFARAPKPSEK